jgi:GGDEF domain-containing protein
MNSSVLSQEEIEALLKDSKESFAKQPSLMRDEITGFYNLGFFLEEFRRVQGRLNRQNVLCTIGIVRVDGIPSLTGKREILARIFWTKFGKLVKIATREKSEDLVAVIEPGLFVILIPNNLLRSILVLERILNAIETTPWNDWGGLDNPVDFLVSLTEVNPNEELDPVLYRVSKGIHTLTLSKNTRWQWERNSGQVFMHIEAKQQKEG